MFSIASGDYVDEGGNSASGNSCNGIFVDSSKKSCKTFDLIAPISPPSAVPTTASPTNTDTLSVPAPTKDPSAYPSIDSGEIGESTAAPGEVEDYSCVRNPIGNGWCTDVGNSFDELKRVIENGYGEILFCEFTVEMKATDKFIFITSDVDLICKTSHKCVIKGANNHFVISGSSSKVFVQGFVFEGSSIGAVHIQKGTSQVQSFCNNKFVANKGIERGLAIRAEKNTITEVVGCHFEKNESTDMGGSVFNRGVMLIMNSVFRDNIGRGGW